MNHVSYAKCVCYDVDCVVVDLDFETDLNLPNDFVVTCHCAPWLSEYFVAI